MAAAVKKVFDLVRLAHAAMRRRRGGAAGRGRGPPARCQAAAREVKAATTVLETP